MAKEGYNQASVGLLFLMNKLVKHPEAFEGPGLHRSPLQSNISVSEGILFFISKFLQNPSSFHGGPNNNMRLAPVQLVNRVKHRLDKD